MEEQLAIDVDFDIQYNIYLALRNTISQAIDAEMQKDKKSGRAPMIQKELILTNFLAHNIDLADEECYITHGPDGKIYLCGSWLLRPVTQEKKSVPMMEYLQSALAAANVNTEKLMFRPHRTGVEMRKELWPKSDATNTSYALPRSTRNSFGEKNEFQRPPMGGAMPPFGAPPAGMPPLGMAGARPPMGAPAGMMGGAMPPFGAPPAGMPPLGMAGGHPPMGAPARVMGGALPPLGAPPAGMPPPGMAGARPPMGAPAGAMGGALPPLGAPQAGMPLLRGNGDMGELEELEAIDDEEELEELESV